MRPVRLHFASRAIAPMVFKELEQGASMLSVAQKYGINRKTVVEWVRRGVSAGHVSLRVTSRYALERMLRIAIGEEMRARGYPRTAIDRHLRLAKRAGE